MEVKKDEFSKIKGDDDLNEKASDSANNNNENKDLMIKINEMFCNNNNKIQTVPKDTNISITYDKIKIDLTNIVQYPKDTNPIVFLLCSISGEKIAYHLSEEYKNLIAINNVEDINLDNKNKEGEKLNFELLGKKRGEDILINNLNKRDNNKIIDNKLYEQNNIEKEIKNYEEIENKENNNKLSNEDKKEKEKKNNIISQKENKELNLINTEKILCEQSKELNNDNNKKNIEEKNENEIEISKENNNKINIVQKNENEINIIKENNNKNNSKNNKENKKENTNSDRINLEEEKGEENIIKKNEEIITKKQLKNNNLNDNQKGQGEIFQENIEEEKIDNNFLNTDENFIDENSSTNGINIHQKRSERKLLGIKKDEISPEDIPIKEESTQIIKGNCFLLFQVVIIIKIYILNIKLLSKVHFMNYNLNLQFHQNIIIYQI